MKTIAEQLAEKTLKELSEGNKKPKPDSRNWQDPKGYQYLAVWQNAALLRVLVRKFTETLPSLKGKIKGEIGVERNFGRSLNQPLTQTLNSPLKTLKSEHRLISQMDDEARSIKRNIEEGWKRPTTIEYLTFLGYSQASLEELKGDIRDCKTDGFLNSIPGSSLKGIEIDLRVIKGPNRDKGETYGEPTDPTHPYYQPLTTLKPETLTYEIFMELINKTDYLLRSLVVSLENKLSRDRKYYQIDQARLRTKAKGEI